MARIEFGTRVKWGCSYKRITLIVCSINIVIALYVLHCLYSSVYIYSNNNSSQDSKCLSFINLLLLLILGFHRIVSYDGSCQLTPNHFGTKTLLLLLLFNWFGDFFAFVLILFFLTHFFWLCYLEFCEVWNEVF